MNRHLHIQFIQCLQQSLLNGLLLLLLLIQVGLLLERGFILLAGRGWRRGGVRGWRRRGRGRGRGRWGVLWGSRRLLNVCVFCCVATFHQDRGVDCGHLWLVGFEHVCMGILMCLRWVCSCAWNLAIWILITVHINWKRWIIFTVILIVKWVYVSITVNVYTFLWMIILYLYFAIVITKCYVRVGTYIQIWLWIWIIWWSYIFSVSMSIILIIIVNWVWIYLYMQGRYRILATYGNSLLLWFRLFWTIHAINRITIDIAMTSISLILIAIYSRIARHLVQSQRRCNGHSKLHLRMRWGQWQLGWLMGL